jgi:hypothetical protein
MNKSVFDFIIHFKKKFSVILLLKKSFYITKSRFIKYYNYFYKYKNTRF